MICSSECFRPSYSNKTFGLNIFYSKEKDWVFHKAWNSPLQNCFELHVYYKSYKYKYHCCELVSISCTSSWNSDHYKGWGSQKPLHWIDCRIMNISTESCSYGTRRRPMPITRTRLVFVADLYSYNNKICHVRIYAKKSVFCGRNYLWPYTYCYHISYRGNCYIIIRPIGLDMIDHVVAGQLRRFEAAEACSSPENFPAWWHVSPRHLQQKS